MVSEGDWKNVLPRIMDSTLYFYSLEESKYKYINVQKIMETCLKMQFYKSVVIDRVFVKDDDCPKWDWGFRKARYKKKSRMS